MKASAIVCTYNRPHAIVACLESMAQSMLAATPAECEIIAVDNASTDETAVVIRKWAETCKVPMQIVFEAKKGVSAARNAGIRAAQGDLILFIDDDCQMSREYVSDALRHDAADKDTVMRGCRVLLGDPADLPLTILTCTETKRWSLALRSARREHLGGTILGCNMAIRRAFFDRVGFFEEKIGAGTRVPGGEDTDLVFRAYLAGITIEYVPDMVIYHHHGRKKPGEGKKLFQSYMIATGALYARYILKSFDLCRQFIWDIKGMRDEILSGKNTFLPEADFSHKDKVVYSVRGMFRYWSVLLKGR